MAKGGFGKAALDIEKFMSRKLEEIDNHVGYAVNKATQHGEESMKRVIETTTSPTGQERAGNGGHPGRIDTGNMFDAVESDVNAYGTLENRRHVGDWGWLTDLEEYFLRQEHDDSVSAYGAMNSLRQSYIEAREMLYEELSDI